VPRIPRVQQGGDAYHGVNLGNGARDFHKSQDYQAFLSLLAEAKKRHRVKIFGFCLMPNHFHFLLEPAYENALAKTIREKDW
jgi:putative transposase